MMPTSPAKARHPWSGFGKWKCMRLAPRGYVTVTEGPNGRNGSKAVVANARGRAESDDTAPRHRNRDPHSNRSAERSPPNRHCTRQFGWEPDVCLSKTVSLDAVRVNVRDAPS